MINTYKPSLYQEKIFENIKNGYNNIVINAVAGSGKTTTIVKSLELIPKDKKILFIAFNRDIVGELNKKIDKGDNINIVTYHSLGSSILRENIRCEDSCKLDVYKYNTYIKNNINILSNGNYINMKKGKYNTYISNIISLVNYSRFNLAQNEKEINECVEKYGLILIDDEINVVIKVLEWGVENTSTIDYTDMIWIPVENDFKTKKYRYDWVFIDEAQDSSIMQQKLIDRCFKRGAHFCAVGDTFQCINAWAGADSKAFENFINKNNTQTFHLPVSYRCPKCVINEAQKFVPQIKHKDGAIIGDIKINVKSTSPKNGDMVICRNTEPLIRLYVKYLRINKKCFIKGRDLGEHLIDLINDTTEDILNTSLISKGVFSELYNRLFILRNSYMEKYGIDKVDAIMSPQVINLYENIKSIKTLSENLTTRNELIDKIKVIFIENDGDGVCLTTIHKSKGLEADNVFILCPSLIPSKLAKSEWEIEAERNLEYVAITRSKKTLNYICEKDFKPLTFFNNQYQLLKELDEIENKLDFNNNIKEEYFKNIDKEIKINILKEKVNEKPIKTISFKNKMNKFL